MVLWILVLYIRYIIVAYPQCLQVVAFLEYTCSLCQIHYRLWIFLLQKVIYLETSSVQQLLEYFLELFHFLGGLLIFNLVIDIYVCVLVLHVSELTQQGLHRSEDQVAHFVRDAKGNKDDEEYSHTEDYKPDEGFAFDDLDVVYTLSEGIYTHTDEKLES